MSRLHAVILERFPGQWAPAADNLIADHFRKGPDFILGVAVHPQAQKTRAELSNKNLLTSSEAEINTKPELEIYADDVQCAHGATVAQLDEGSLHYLRTRGVSREEAEVMLSFGFINELIEGVGNDAVRDYLRSLLATRFARDTELARHLL